VAADICEEKLQRLARASGPFGLVDNLLDPRSGLLLRQSITHLEPDPLKRTRQILDLGTNELALDGEGLKLGWRNPAALLAQLEHRATPSLPSNSASRSWPN